MGNKEHQNTLNKLHHPYESAAQNLEHNKTNPTLQELGEEYGFNVNEGFPSNHGPCPGPGYKLSTLHGWYKESEGIPRC